MGFNYLQTDDRDDYLSQFSRNKIRRRPTGYTLTSPIGEILLENVPTSKIRAYCKIKYLLLGQSGKHVWRSILLSKGYNVVPVFLK